MGIRHKRKCVLISILAVLAAAAVLTVLAVGVRNRVTPEKVQRAAK